MAISDQVLLMLNFQGSVCVCMSVPVLVLWSRTGRNVKGLRDLPFTSDHSAHRALWLLAWGVQECVFLTVPQDLPLCTVCSDSLCFCSSIMGMTRGEFLDSVVAKVRHKVG